MTEDMIIENFDEDFNTADLELFEEISKQNIQSGHKPVSDEKKQKFDSADYMMKQFRKKKDLNESGGFKKEKENVFN
jgi:hypothetical protein